MLRCGCYGSSELKEGMAQGDVFTFTDKKKHSQSNATLLLEFL
jgi:hypothetical protein